MQSTVLTIMLPAALSIVMLGLGLSLTPADFRRILQHPRVIAASLAVQFVALPALAVVIAKIFGLQPELAVGFILLAAAPSGATATLMAHLARADVALALTITAVSSLLSVAALPVLVNAALAHFMGEGRAIPLQLGKTLQVFAVVLPPVAIGMLIRHYKEGIAAALDKPVRILSALFLVGVIAAAVVQERANIGSYFAQVGIAALAFNVLSGALAFGAAVAVGAIRAHATAATIAVCMRNGTLAITVAGSASLLNNMTMAVPAAVYSLLMFFTAAAFGFAMRPKAGSAGQEPPAS